MSAARAPGAPTRAVRDPTDYPELLARVPAIFYTAARGIDGAWLYASPQIEAILGYTAEEWCADPTLWRRRLHPDDLDWAIEDELARTVGNRETSAVEYRMLHRDGHVVWVRDDAVLLHEPDGTLRWHGVLFDVSQRTRTEAQLERAAARHAAVAALGEHALEGMDSDKLADEAITAAVELLGVEFGGMLELSPDGRTFTFLASRGLGDAWAQVGQKLPCDPTTQPGYAITNGRVVVSDWSSETRFRPTPLVSRTGVRSGMTILVEGASRRYGVIGVHSSTAREFSAMDIDFVQAVANVLGDAFERRQTEHDMRHRALHDPLTGLPNRTLFMDRLGHALQHLRRRGSRAAVLFLDLDRFKLVNESLGHEIGDELLAAAAPRLKQTVRTSDTVARFGADEFGILLEDIGGEHDAVEMAQRIAAVFTRPFVLQGEEHFVSTSIGITLASGGERAEDLVRDAEAAMHRAQERGRARYELFDEAIRGRALSRLRVENDLRRALERDELTLDYQPILSLRDRSIVSVEALLRWDHPERGRVPPLQFIPIAEENGLIEPIGRWVLDNACQQAARWYASRPDSPPLSVAVNLSAMQFEGAHLVSTVDRAISDAGLDPSLLHLEITESVVMGRGEEISDALAALKALGVRLVLDDFGTGYSSLAYLTRLPIDVLKVDRSFVDGLGTEARDTTITEAIIVMSHALSLEVVGEGAETERQVAELHRLRCDLVQGFHFSRPVAATCISEMLTAGDAPASPPRA